MLKQSERKWKKDLEKYCAPDMIAVKKFLKSFMNETSEVDFMELKEFIGKVVISPQTNRRYFLYEITAPQIKAWTEKADVYGHHTCYCWETINGDPISNGYLIFEDPSLTEPFKTAYNAYCRTKDAYCEMYGYWMRKD